MRREETSWAEEFALPEGLRQSGAVDGDARALGPGAPGVAGPGDNHLKSAKPMPGLPLDRIPHYCPNVESVECSNV